MVVMAAVAEEESETQLCSNCKKDIPVANFTIHEIHCSRNIGVCSFCQESVPKSEMENHMELEHTQASACPLRPVACQHCDLELAFHKLQDHMDYCGTRTEECSRCSRNVMLKDLEEHLEDCGKKAEESRVGQPQPCVNSEASLRNIQTIRNILHSDGSPGPPPGVNRLYNCLSGQKLPRNHPRRNVDPLQPDGNQGDGIKRESGRLEKTDNTLAFGGGEPDCHLDYLLALSLQQDNFQQEHSPAKLQRDFWKSICPARTSPTGNSLEANHFSNFSQDFLGSVNSSNNSKGPTLLPCEFCEELYPEEDLILHQDERLTDLWEQLQRNQSSGREACPLQPDSGGSVMIPCEFCGVQLKEEALFHHQDRCDLRPATGRSLSQPRPPAMEDLERTELPDLPKRSVHHQGDVSPRYLEEFQQQSPPQPVRGRHSRGHPVAARRVQLNSPSNKRETEIGPSERGKLNDQGGGGKEERTQRGGQRDRMAELRDPAPVRRSPHNCPPSSYVPSFPVAVPTRPSLRSEGSTRAPGPGQYSRRTAKPWQTEPAYPDEE
uniref:Uncharacterized protein n=1 Tax=Sphaerodactylus townsendi TaxID=933632 RepID=A0ACB8G0U4_9SAUR